jgi:uncharacterized protein YkwD
MKRLALIASLLLTAACAETFEAPAGPTTENDWSFEDSGEPADDAPETAHDFGPKLPERPVSPVRLEEAEKQPTDAEQFRADVVDLVNQVRATGANCGEHGQMAPADAMQADVRLAEAAEKHSQDMAAHDFLDHEGSDGRRFWDRATEVGYDGTARGENVAGGYPTPEEVVEAWLDSDGHCLVLMLPETNEIGVGYAFSDHTTYGHFWTMVTGIR